MSASLEAAYEEPSVIDFWAVELTVPGGTVRLTTGGTVVFEGETWTARHPDYGTLSMISAIVDGAGDQASSVDVVMLPPSSSALAALASPAAQGSKVRIFNGVVDDETGAVTGYEEVFAAEVDYAPLTVDEDGWVLTLECVTEELRQKEDDGEKRLAPLYHTSIWPGETGLNNVTAVTRKIYWRANGPSGAARYGGGGGGGAGGGPGFQNNVPQVRV